MAALRSRLHRSLLRFQLNLAACRDGRWLRSFRKYEGTNLIHTTSIFVPSASFMHIPIYHQPSSCLQVRVFNSSSIKDEIHSTTKPREIIDPHRLVEEQISSLTLQIKQELQGASQELYKLVEYYFDGQGKLFRPMVVLLMSQACNQHHDFSQSLITEDQNKIAMISEMIHTASLIHDDVIDAADTRRGKTSINMVWGQRMSILAGDYVISIASMLLARIRNDQIVIILSQVIEDLVRGEFMQLGSKEDESERFTHYLRKTFKKTASLLANSCQAVSILANCPEEVTEIAYQYGKNIGIAFQLIDDLLDFTSCDLILGKPTAADLKLGLATAPVLFAAQDYPELNSLIMRRFSLDGDVETARHLVAKSDGVEETRYLANQHGREAIKQIKLLKQSESQQALINLINTVLTRKK
ncbi:hypothetical protein LOTGIDRAFT_219858 [Lottia gigantea]|uniref:All trans-polyprenyl-diphosphate synthase PDSS1 n=1 Tax=Lottia gigantea TaxID=225164 RepID=V4A2Z8_LOTGI|nr:hypothetical protein LOTGIDRAFT_219858 [Lottia gigantea]ESO87681.1 hypothetical protein LOTGIDRAFT_219858 [Lottia gigantea]